MRRTLVPLALSSALAVACGSPSPHPPYPAAPPPSPSSVNALADLPQDLALAPGDRNTWSIDRDFALQDGGDDQFQRAVQLHVGVPTSLPNADSLPGDLGPGVLPFPFDPPDGQRWSELSFTTPVVARGAAQLAAQVTTPIAGWSGQAVALAGSFGVGGSGPAATRLSQTVDLRSLATGTPLTLGWSHAGAAGDGLIPGPQPALWRVLILDAASGAELLEAYRDGVLLPGPVAPVDASVAAGKQVTIAFELLGSPGSFAYVDGVSLAGATEYLTNGDFEAASLAPWTVTGPDLPCQVVSGRRTVNGLEIERRVFARPDQRWARFVDVFDNPSGATVTTEVSYLHELGAATNAVIQGRPSRKALSARDGSLRSPPRRDVAIVYGAGSTTAFRSVSAPGLGDGSPNVWTSFPLTVPAGQTRIIVQFLVLTESAAGASLANPEADAIVNGFWPTTTYREGMTVDEVAAIVNF